MKAKLLEKTFLILLILLYCAPLHSHYNNVDLGGSCKLQNSYKNVKETFILVLDAGHGGKDPGTMGPHSAEKNIALAIVKRAGKLISEKFPDVTIIYTRNDDTFVELFERINIANASKADLFISVHCNASARRKAKGTETYVMGLHTANENLETAKRENSVILMESDYQNNYEGFDPNSDAGHIILSMYQNTYLDQSIEFATLIENSFGVKTSRGVKQAGFVVLRRATMPSVLIESGFLSNPIDEKKLLSAKGQNKVATSIVDAFGKYKKQKELQQVKSIEKSNRLVIKEPIKITSKLVAQESLSFFAVQIAATEKENKMAFKNVPDLHIKKEKNLFKYLSGNFTSKALALKAKEKLNTLGYKSAFIVELH